MFWNKNPWAVHLSRLGPGGQHPTVPSLPLYARPPQLPPPPPTLPPPPMSHSAMQQLTQLALSMSKSTPSTTPSHPPLLFAPTTYRSGSSPAPTPTPTLTSSWPRPPTSQPSATPPTQPIQPIQPAAAAAAAAPAPAAAVPGPKSSRASNVSAAAAASSSAPASSSSPTPPRPSPPSLSTAEPAAPPSSSVPTAPPSSLPSTRSSASDPVISSWTHFFLSSCTERVPYASAEVLTQLREAITEGLAPPPQPIRCLKERGTDNTVMWAKMNKDSATLLLWLFWHPAFQLEEVRNGGDANVARRQRLQPLCDHIEGSRLDGIEAYADRLSLRWIRELHYYFYQVLDEPSRQRLKQRTVHITLGLTCHGRYRSNGCGPRGESRGNSHCLWEATAVGCCPPQRASSSSIFIESVTAERGSSSPPWAVSTRPISARSVPTAPSGRPSISSSA